MTTYYIGRDTDGNLVSRGSTRSDFTHAAFDPDYRGEVPSFGTSAAGALANMQGRSSPARHHRLRVVPVRVVSAKEYREARKGLT